MGLKKVGLSAETVLHFVVTAWRPRSWCVAVPESHLYRRRHASAI
ncbi:DUF676 domain-containing protein [Psidium guajava]|nr:DUF676 domain-containing protein [Psidium guajava]